MGWRTRYMEDTEFRRRAVALSSLACLPVAYVGHAFELLKFAFPPEEQLIPEYFGRTYVGNNMASSASSDVLGSVALFPPVFWNNNGRPMYGMPTTTSARGRFHLSQQHSVHNVSHPSIPVFLEDPHRQIAIADLRMASIMAGDRREPGQVFRRKMEKCSSILSSLTEGNIMEVLTQITNVRLHSGDSVRGTGFRLFSTSGEFDVTLHHENVPVSQESLGEGGADTVELPERMPEELQVSTDGSQGDLAGHHDQVEALEMPLPNEPRSEGEHIESIQVEEQVPAAHEDHDPREDQLPGPRGGIQEAADWLVRVGYNQRRHGPHDHGVLQQTMLKITASRSREPSDRAKGR